MSVYGTFNRSTVYLGLNNVAKETTNLLRISHFYSRSLSLFLSISIPIKLLYFITVELKTYNRFICTLQDLESTYIEYIVQSEEEKDEVDGGDVEAS